MSPAQTSAGGAQTPPAAKPAAPAAKTPAAKAPAGDPKAAAGGAKAAPGGAQRQGTAQTAAGGTVGDGSQLPQGTPTTPPVSAGASAMAKLVALDGASVTGRAMLYPVDEGVRVIVDIENLAPGKRGVHVHEKADCSHPKGLSAGGHLNPMGHPHGLPPAEKRHLGDLGNAEIGEEGRGRLELIVKGANLHAGDKMSLLDRAIVVHNNADDGTDPMGNAGSRIACGEVKSVAAAK